MTDYTVAIGRLPISDKVYVKETLDADTRHQVLEILGGDYIKYHAYSIGAYTVFGIMPSPKQADINDLGFDVYNALQVLGHEPHFANPFAIGAIASKDMLQV